MRQPVPTLPCLRVSDLQKPAMQSVAFVLREIVATFRALLSVLMSTLLTTRSMSLVGYLARIDEAK
jgi:hypothetical protein